MAVSCPCPQESVYMWSHVACGTLTGDGLNKYIQNDEKETHSLVENNRFEIKCQTEDQGISIPKSIGTLTKLRCSKWGKCLLLSSIWTWRSRSMNLQNNRDLNQVFCTSCPNLVILAWTGDKLCDWRTHTHIHTHRRRWWQYQIATKDWHYEEE